MSYSQSRQFAREVFPETIKKIIALTAIISILSALFNPFIEHFFPFLAPQRLLGLSLWGIKNLFIWQPLSYMFILSAPYGISLSFIINLFFNMLMVWFIGSRIVEQIGSRSFLILYFSSGIIAAFSALAAMSVTGNPILIAGCSPSIYALLTMWMLIFPEAEILLFFFIPIKVKWLITGILGIYALISISSLQIVDFASVFTGVITAYVYGIVFFDFRTPFLRLRGFEASLNRTGMHILKILATLSPQKPISKIFDINTGKPRAEDDDSFMDRMLAKISEKGAGSLSYRERRRMKNISKNKRRPS